MSIRNKEENPELEQVVSMIHRLDYGYTAEQNVLNSYVLSQSFYQKMNDMVSKHERREKWIRFGKMCAAVVVVALLLWNFYHPQYVQAIYQKFFQWYEDHVEFRGNARINDEEGAIPRMELTYLPDGIEVEEEYYDLLGGYIKCKGNVYFSYSLNCGLLDINNEGVDFYVLSDSEDKILCFDAAKSDRMSHIVWYWDNERIICCISGYESVQELLRIKNGINEKK